MSAKTLFEAAKHIICILNFMGYGLGWETRKDSGWVKGLLEWMLKINVTVLFIIFVFFAEVYLFGTNIGSNCMSMYYSARLYAVLYGLTFADYFVLLNQTQLRNLVGEFTSFPVMKESGKALRKCLLPFYLYLAINMIPLISVFLWLSTVFFNPDETWGITDMCLFYWLFPSLFLLILFPVFLCYFACLVPVYCVARVKELVQEVKSARSSLRKAKMTSDLLREYYRLKRLASMTDETVSTAMSLFHQLFVMEFALTVAMVNSGLKADERTNRYLQAPFVVYPIFLIPFFVHVFPFLIYKRFAPPANLMHLLIFKALVDIMVIDDQWLSRDPLLRPLLIKMRVWHVFDVSHIVLEESSFTHFGEAIEGEALFTIFLEAIDMYNTISAPARHLSVSESLRHYSYSCESDEFD